MANTLRTCTRDWKRSGSGPEAPRRAGLVLFPNVTSRLWSGTQQKCPSAAGTFGNSCWREAPRKNRALAGPVVVCRPKPTITFQRGTAGCILVATWEERRQGCLQRKSNMRRIAPANNAEGRMSAMTAWRAELICVNRETLCENLTAARRVVARALLQKSHCCAFATRKSHAACFRNSTAAPSQPGSRGTPECAPRISALPDRRRTRRR